MARKVLVNQDLSEFDDAEPMAVPARGTLVDDGTDPLFTLYGLHSTLPFRVKIRRLAMGWGMTAEEIADLLHARDEIESVQKVFEECEAEWKELGEPLHPEAQTLARGRMIAELMEVKRAVEEMHGANSDIKLLNLKMTVLDRIAKLRNLEADKKPMTDAPTQGLNIADALDNLNKAQLADLVKRLGSD